MQRQEDGGEGGRWVGVDKQTGWVDFGAVIGGNADPSVLVNPSRLEQTPDLTPRHRRLLSRAIIVVDESDRLIPSTDSEADKTASMLGRLRLQRPFWSFGGLLEPGTVVF